ncbi:hypothetical protein, variant [Verruconis gallopava]|uniref:Uncharacterized protein n=1 Tax=Verruconis gallopava TaxID=253628 RepID=A0A0D2AJE0_9PEZI|nr:uncharacterized protein PV09_09246 [Verruconis gallopava]XP_016208888.1 hypothetical protein, variant [Verruconis gallopava]KIV99017.1 hypothetical protein PV09_09246 [Verruconis gallopava]KIV99018.1 hypothetical protein, variant [Verruconis gallopava]
MSMDTIKRPAPDVISTDRLKRGRLDQEQLSCGVRNQKDEANCFLQHIVGCLSNGRMPVGPSTEPKAHTGHRISATRLPQNSQGDAKAKRRYSLGPDCQMSRVGVDGRTPALDTHTHSYDKSRDKSPFRNRDCNAKSGSPMDITKAETTGISFTATSKQAMRSRASTMQPSLDSPTNSAETHATIQSPCTSSAPNGPAVADEASSPTPDQRAASFLSNLAALMEASYHHAHESAVLEKLRARQKARLRFFDEVSSKAHENEIKNQERAVQKAEEQVCENVRPLFNLVKDLFIAQPSPNCITSEKDIRELKDEISLLNQREKEHQACIERLSTRNQELEASMKDVTSTLKDHLRRFEQLSAEDEALRKQIKEAERRAAEAQSGVEKEAEQRNQVLNSLNQSMAPMIGNNVEFDKLVKNVAALFHETRAVTLRLNEVKSEIDKSVREWKDSLNQEIRTIIDDTKALGLTCKVGYRTLESKLELGIKTNKTIVDAVQARCDKLSSTLNDVQNNTRADYEELIAQNAKSLEVNALKERLDEVLHDINMVKTLNREGFNNGKEKHSSLMDRQDAIMKRMGKHEAELDRFEGALSKVEEVQRDVEEKVCDMKTWWIDVQALRRLVEGMSDQLTISLADIEYLKKHVEELLNDVKPPPEDVANPSNIAGQTPHKATMFERVKLLELQERYRHDTEYDMLKHGHTPAALGMRLRALEETNQNTMRCLAFLESSTSMLRNNVDALQSGPKSVPGEALLKVNCDINHLQAQIQKLQETDLAELRQHLDKVVRVQSGAIQSLENRIQIINSAPLAKQILDQLSPKVLAAREPKLQSLEAALNDTRKQMGSFLTQLATLKQAMRSMGSKVEVRHKCGAANDTTPESTSELEIRLDSHVEATEQRFTQIYDHYILPLEMRLSDEVANLEKKIADTGNMDTVCGLEQHTKQLKEDVLKLGLQVATFEGKLQRVQSYLPLVHLNDLNLGTRTIGMPRDADNGSSSHSASSNVLGILRATNVGASSGGCQ